MNLFFFSLNGVFLWYEPLFYFYFLFYFTDTDEESNKFLQNFAPNYVNYFFNKNREIARS